jgi:hypothetical protein
VNGRMLHATLEEALDILCGCVCCDFAPHFRLSAVAEVGAGLWAAWRRSSASPSAQKYAESRETMQYISDLLDDSPCERQRQCTKGRIP